MTNNSQSAYGLPRLMYVGDIPVEYTVAGSLCVARLLDGYPSEKAVIVETIERSRTENRVPGFRYEAWEPFVLAGRLLRTRFGALFHEGYTWAAPSWRRGLRKYVRDFRPQAILSVVHGYGWMTAAALAEEHEIPLHLICHDDWATRIPPGRWVGSLWEERFAAAYRYARGRLCVSALMEAEFAKRYGCRGTVLPPLWPRNGRRIAGASIHCNTKRDRGTFNGIYLGSINAAETAETLRQLGNILQHLGGKLLYYGLNSKKSARKWRFSAESVEARGLMESGRLLEICRKEADFLFVSMPFGRDNDFRLSFPSKMVEYTMVGLPIVLHAPPGCAAADWAKRNEGVVGLVTEGDSEALREVIYHLQENTDYRARLGARAVAVGQEMFAHDVVQSRFFSVLEERIDIRR